MYILTGDKAGLWCDFATGETGDLIDLWWLVTGLKLVEVLDRARDYLGMERPEGDRELHMPRKTYKLPPSRSAVRRKARRSTTSARCATSAQR